MKFTALKNAIAIDLGTDFTRIYYKGEYINEPSVVAYDSIDGSIVALGEEAYQMIGKNPPSITVSKPLVNGVINNFELACQMVHGFLSKVMGNVIKPIVFVTVPCGVTDVERRALCDTLRAMDITEIYVVDSSIAGAIGANCDVSLARGMMIIDFGGGKCDMSVISLGQSVVSRTFKLAGNDFTDVLKDYIKQKHNLEVGEQSAEKLKRKIGCIYMREQNTLDTISGFNLHTKKPEKIVIRAEETKEAFLPLVSKVITEIKAMLDEIPTALLGDIMEDGILMIGGGAQLYGLAKHIRNELKMKVFLAEDAEMCIVRGGAYIADNMDKLGGNSYIYKKG